MNSEMSGSYMGVILLSPSSMLSSSSLQHAKTGTVAVGLSASEDRALNRSEQTCETHKHFQLFATNTLQFIRIFICEDPRFRLHVKNSVGSSRYRGSRSGSGISGVRRLNWDQSRRVGHRAALAGLHDFQGIGSHPTPAALR